MNVNSVKVFRAYKTQLENAKRRGIEWKFTYDSWCEVWKDKWEFRGKTRYDMCMARKGDVGAYSPDNVEIITVSENSKFVLTHSTFTEKSRSHTKHNNTYYIYKGKRYKTQQKISEDLGLTAGWINTLVRNGKVKKYYTHDPVKIYRTPYGDFKSIKESKKAINSNELVPITDTSVRGRFKNKNMMDYMIIVVQEPDQLLN